MKLFILDISTQEPIANVLFEIFDEYDNLVFSDYTDSKGVLKIDNLRKGRYYFVEKSVDEPYILNSDKHWFEITEDGEIIKSTVYNEKKIDVPDTATSGIGLIDIIGFIALVLGVVYLIYEKKQK